MQRIFIFAALVLWLMSCQHSPAANSLKQANSLARQKLWREASDAYRKVLAEDPTNAMANRNLGIILVRFGVYREAWPYLQQARSRYDRDYGLNYYAAEAKRGLGEYQEAIAYYKIALVSKSDSPATLAALAWTYLKVGQREIALTYSQRLQSKKSKNIDHLAIHARILLALNKNTEALSLVRAAKRRIPPHQLAYLLSIEGDALYALGQEEKALKIYAEALKANTLLAGPLLGLGKYYAAKKNIPLAIQNLEKAVRLRPQLSEGHLLLGSLYEKSNNQRAAVHYQQYLKYTGVEGDQRESVAEKIKRLKAES
jgi:tetratricopeptide (TPR) repeat protein